MKEQNKKEDSQTADSPVIKGDAVFAGQMHLNADFIHDLAQSLKKRNRLGTPVNLAYLAHYAAEDNLHYMAEPVTFDKLMAFFYLALPQHANRFKVGLVGMDRVKENDRSKYVFTLEAI